MSQSITLASVSQLYTYFEDQYVDDKIRGVSTIHRLHEDTVSKSKSGLSSMMLLFYFPSVCSGMVIVVGPGHGETTSNPEWGWLHFT